MDDQANQRNQKDADEELASVCLVESGEKAQDSKELHVVGQVPGLLKAERVLLPGKDVIEVEKVPNDCTAAAMVFFKLVEPWSIASDDWYNLPYEE